MVGCNNNQDIIIQNNSTFIHQMNDSEFQERCWEETMWQCQEYCSEISGLEYSGLLSYNVLQFDLNNDSVINGSEEKEMNYVLRRNKLCMDKCSEETYICF
jgi:hypothetical protein